MCALVYHFNSGVQCSPTIHAERGRHTQSDRDLPQMSARMCALAIQNDSFCNVCTSSYIFTCVAEWVLVLPNVRPKDTIKTSSHSVRSNQSAVKSLSYENAFLNSIYLYPLNTIQCSAGAMFKIGCSIRQSWLERIY